MRIVINPRRTCPARRRAEYIRAGKGTPPEPPRAPSPDDDQETGIDVRERPKTKSPGKMSAPANAAKPAPVARKSKT